MFGEKVMRAMIGATGSVVVGSALLLAAVGPARAADVSDTAKWQATMNARLDGAIRDMSVVPATIRDTRAVVVAAAFDEAGSFRSAELARSSGNAALDREAVRAVKTLSFPRLPAAIRGTRRVPVKVFFGDSTPQAEAFAEAGVASVRGIDGFELAAR